MICYAMLCMKICFFGVPYADMGLSIASAPLAGPQGGLRTLKLKEAYYGSGSLQLVPSYFHLARTNQCVCPFHHIPIILQNFQEMSIFCLLVKKIAWWVQKLEDKTYYGRPKNWG